MSRVRLSAVVGLLVVAWFALGSEVLGEALKQAQARSATQVQLHDVVLAIVLTREQAPADLPRGEAAAEARALLEEALEQDRVRAEWPQLAAAALGPELLAVAAAGTDRAPMPRTRAHPHLPPDLLAVEALHGDLQQRLLIPSPAASKPSPADPRPHRRVGTSGVDYRPTTRLEACSPSWRPAPSRPSRPAASRPRW